tara:strand:+ start:731 stop:1144 length:414 start_codon:yes stop_codon:yes gene_type:complete
VANISITATDVVRVSGSYSQGLLGATVDAGEMVAYDATNQYWVLATEISGGSNPVKMAISSGVAGQVIGLAEPGAEITLGSAVMTAGDVLVASATTAGKIAPHSDLVAGDTLYIVGYAKTTDEIVLILKYTGVELPT